MVISRFFQAKIENYGIPGISRELLDSKTGLVGFKRIHAHSKITNTKIFKSILKHLQIKVENLEAAAEKSSQGLGLY